MTDERAVVWIDSWQFECCGDRFEVGDRVDWTVVERVERDWLETVLGSDTARTVTHGEDRHGLEEGSESSMAGKVLSIRMASCRYQPSETERRALVPVPGSEVLRSVDVADGAGGYAGDLRWTGYLVELEVE